MCGIIFGANTGIKKEAINDWVIMQYEDQEMRGSKGFGIVLVDNKGKYKVKRSTEGFKLMYDLHSEESQIMMMHHRMPTSTKNKMGQTHPMDINDGSLKYKYLIIHNGMISNASELKKVHENDLGFVYQTATEEYTLDKFNDSESFAIEIARFIEGQSNEVGTLGSVAFTALQIDKKTDKVIKLYFGRNTNPLNMAKSRGMLRLSSEGMGDSIEANKLYFCALDDEMKLYKRDLKFKSHPVTIVSKTEVTQWKDKDGWIEKERKPSNGYVTQKELLEKYQDAGKTPGGEKKEEEEEEDNQDYLEEMTDNYAQEIEIELGSLIGELCDKTSAFDVDIEGYMKSIRKIITDMAEQAVWWHSGMAEEDPSYQSSLPTKTYGNVSK